MGHVGNGHPQAIAAAAFLHINCVIKVAGIFPVNGHKSNVAKVAALSAAQQFRQTGQLALPVFLNSKGRLQHRSGKFHGNAVPGLDDALLGGQIIARAVIGKNICFPQPPLQRLSRLEQNHVAPAGLVFRHIRGAFRHGGQQGDVHALVHRAAQPALFPVRAHNFGHDGGPTARNNFYHRAFPAASAPGQKGHLHLVAVPGLAEIGRVHKNIAALPRSRNHKAHAGALHGKPPEHISGAPGAIRLFAMPPCRGWRSFFSVPARIPFPDITPDGGTLISAPAAVRSAPPALPAPKSHYLPFGASPPKYRSTSAPKPTHPQTARTQARPPAPTTGNRPIRPV